MAPEFTCTCGSTDCWREEVDIGVGTMTGPWSCNACGVTHRGEPLPEMLDGETDDWEPESDYCECGAFHGEDEFSCGICSCCGLLVDINSESV